MKEQTIIVDENDVIIGHKERGNIEVSDIYRVSALRVQNSQGDVLLAQRKFTKKKDPGKRGPAVAGTNEKGETYLSNIIKEAEEEIGLTGYTFTADKKSRRRGKISNYFGQWFTVTVDREIDKFIIEEDAVEQIARYPREKLRQELEDFPEKFLQNMKENFEYFCGENK